MSSYLPSRSVDREKAESELSLNIKKATNPDETAPKQKHVRSAIVYTWEYHASQSVWNGLKVQPILADEVQTFKALITVHKIIRGGHPVPLLTSHQVSLSSNDSHTLLPPFPQTIKDALRETTWLEACARSVMGEGQRGYGILIRAYVEFLMKKLNYHRLHPEFTGNFDYEEYISLKNIDDPNEGYETISDLMNLQDQIDQFQKLIFNHFRSSSNNECRIAALVPLVEESHAIYKFITSMLRAMHRRTDSSDALTPLRTRYNAQHYALLKFYYECSNLRYLTSLISVPKLPQVC
ncbi:transmembrane actin-binding protein [Jimgerdemannia flammicorona]|uniref:Transmembrane actin-binding protein n=1 Tax=Jimgerdemannia flammicorona TaxID=994334 RepID=A0A433A0X1_9FUNG|nr:transmembrane actin-binding protein [Jimgerdemannia flammicorona]